MKAKTVEFIKQWKKSREQLGTHLLNFLANLSKAALLMHACLRAFRKDESLMESAKQNYVISITSCLETYYRDLFIDVLHKNESLLEKMLLEIKGGKESSPRLVEMYYFHKGGFSFAEIATSYFRFQAIEEIDGSVSKLLHSFAYGDLLAPDST